MKIKLKRIKENEFEILDNEKFVKQISRLTDVTLRSKYENDPDLIEFISKLSNQYKTYKESYKFPTKLKSI